MKKQTANDLFPADIHDRSELTIEKLRKYPGFENVSDEEAKEEIHGIKTFARILFDIYKRDQAEESIKS